MPPINIPLSNTAFNLDSSEVAGFFGGEEAVAAMGSTLHLFRGQKWLGWYNSPGSYHAAKQYGKLANNRFWDALFPGKNLEPTEFFGFDGMPGPEFISWSSGERLKTTGYIAHTVARAAQTAKGIQVLPKYPMGHCSRPSHVTVVDLPVVGEVSPAPLHGRSFLAACATIFFSAASCVACGVFGDWYCFAMILLGIISNGLSSCVIGSGELQLLKPSQYGYRDTSGDGILIAGPEVVILCGGYGTVGAMVTASLKLKYPGGPEHRAIGICSLFQYTQFLVQLLLIPQGTLFGQIMFLGTFVVSWVYNCYLASMVNSNEILYELMMKTLNKPKIQRFKSQTRTTMVTLALLILNPSDPEEFFDLLLPKGTSVWDSWREKVLAQYRSRDEFNFDISKIDLSSHEGSLLVDLLQDAETAYSAYQDHFVNNHTS